MNAGWLCKFATITDPFLIYISQENTLFLVQIFIEGIMPVLSLHKTETHKTKIQIMDTEAVFNPGNIQLELRK